MKVMTYEIPVSSSKEGDMIDISSDVQNIVNKSGLRSGIAVVFVPGSTGAVSTVEYEPGLKKDIPRMLERIAPSDEYYEHHKTWGDDNGRGHVRATFIGASITVPFVNGRLTLGTWQQIVFIELDTRARKRRLVVQLLGE